jgi:hypothetical protein
MRMAILAVVAILALAIAAPAHAQMMHGPASGGSTANAPVNGGGGGGGGYGGGSSVGTHGFSGFQPIHYQNAAAHGSSADFELTVFVPYEQAVKMGEAALTQQTKTLGQIAAEYRASKHSHE